MKQGEISESELNSIFYNTGIELTYVDENDIIKFYTIQKDQIFSRNPEIIGTKVQDCHSAKSVGLVNEIIERFKDGKNNVCTFAIKHKGKFALSKYIAIRDDKGNYRGILETVQDISDIISVSEEITKPKWD